MKFFQVFPLKKGVWVPGTLLILVIAVSTAMAAVPFTGPVQPTPVTPSLSAITPLAVQDQGTGRMYRDGEVIVRFQGDSEAEIRDLARRVNNGIGALVQRDFSSLSLPGLQIVTLPSNVSVEDALRYYRGTSGVLYAEPNYIIQHIEPVNPSAPVISPRGVTLQGATSIREQLTSVTPNDQFFSEQWGLTAMQVPDAWSVTKGSPDVIIAVIDSGVDTTHPDLVSNIWKNPGEILNGKDDDGNGYIDDINGYDFFDGQAAPRDDDGHGTACAGIIAASTNNGIGIAGTMWKAQLMCLKVGPSYTDVAAELNAIDYATRMGTSIISCSFGAYDYIQAEHDVIQASPALFVCAAGNDGTDNDVRPSYPASYDCTNIIAVAASDRAGHLADGSDDFMSNYGLRTVDIAAPGTGILTTVPNNRYASGSGTSFAAPYVAGVAGLLKSRNPGLSAGEMKTILLDTADPIGALKGKINSGGRVNAYRALAKAGGSQVVLPAATPAETPAIPRGTLTLTSTPPLALIYLNGAYAGFTPKVFSDLTAGSYKVVIQKSGYQNWERTVEIKGGDNITLDAQLTPSTTQQSSTSTTTLHPATPSTYPSTTTSHTITLQPPSYPGSSSAVVAAVTPGAFIYPSIPKSTVNVSAPGGASPPSSLIIPPNSLASLTPVSQGGTGTGIAGIVTPIIISSLVPIQPVYSPVVPS